MSRATHLCSRWLTAVAQIVFATELAAQGTLSTQGLGFPPGQLSTRAITMGGAIGEVDPLSPLNPAAVGMLRTSIIMMQAEPEYREVKAGAASQRTSVARFPLFLGSMPLGPRWAVMASASTLLDRTWGTSARETQVVGVDTVGSTVSQSSDGSLADVRFAVSYRARAWLQLGFGGHAYSGNDVLKTIHAFDDTVRFSADTLRTALGFGGKAFSTGAVAFWPQVAAIGLTYRRGGTLNTYQGTKIVPGRVGSAPDHFGVSAEYLGIKGTALGLRVATDQWSRLKKLSPTMIVHEGLDIGAGADVLGPRFAGGQVGLRFGARTRTLPFSASATAVRERTLSVGFGLPLASQRAELSVGALRAARTGPVGQSENAWTISTGFLVRP
jgi:hypothetical protein